MKKVCYNNSMTEKGNTMAGLTSLPRKKNIKGQPHKLAYITEAESDLLKSRGGAGKPRKGTKGVPSYDFGDIGVDDYDVMGSDAQAEADAAQEAADAAAAAAAAVGGPESAAPALDAPKAVGSPEATRAAYEATTAATQAAGRSAAADNVSSPEGRGSVDYFDYQFEVDPFDIAEFNISAPKSNIDVLTRMAQENPKGFDRVQDLLNQRQFSTNTLGIPEMNILEKEGLNTFGLGYRGPFEARSPEGLSREDYDPNSLTGAGTDEASDRKALFASFARANRGLTTVEAMAQYNATSPQDQQVSMSDVQSMGFDLNAAVGPQADFREAEAQRGFAQGLGMIGRSLAFGPIGVLSDIALSGRGEGYGKGVVGHVADMFEKVTGIDLPEKPDLGIPSFEEVTLDVVGPAKDTMNPGLFGIGIGPSRAQEIEEQAYAELSSPQMQSVMGPAAIEAAKRDVSSSAREQAETEQAVAMAEVLGRAGFTTVNDLSLDFDGSGQIAPPPVQRPVIKEKEEIIKTPAPRFPVRDTTPDSAIRTLARIYKDDQGNPDEQRARELLGIGIA